MSQRLNEYLAREAGEYLEQMTQLLQPPGQPDPEQLLRLARGVRGSAQMAGAETIARVAERLEDAARSVVSRSIIWSEEIRALALQTVGDLQILLRALNRWGPEEENRVRTAVERWDDLDAPDGDSAVPISALFHDDAGPHVLSPVRPAGADGEPVPVGELLLRGDDALREALALRPRLERLLEGGAAAPAVRAAMDELFDLVRLGLSEASAAT